jgi:predicted O-methyltransferase YrrM
MKTIITEIPDMRTFLRGEKTLSIGYAWLTFGAIMALEQILDDKKDMRILEMGCGGSTIFFAKRCKELITLEHDRNWATMTSEHLPVATKDTPSVVWIINKPHQELLAYLRLRKPESYDLVLADGGSNYTERQELLFASASKLKKGGWLVIDNYERMVFDYTGYDVYTFDMFRYSGRGTRLCKKL